MVIYLYIKQHTITGLKYFGKTNKKNPYKYLGSGKYWLRHINKHGKEYVITNQVFSFNTQEDCTNFALEFSRTNNIVESEEWANMIAENGIGGGATRGHIVYKETKIKISNANKGQVSWRKDKVFGPMSEENKQKISNANKGQIPWNRGKPHTEESKVKMSMARRGKPGRIWTEEQKLKMSIAKKGKPIKPHTEEHKKALSIAMRK